MNDTTTAIITAVLGVLTLGGLAFIAKSGYSNAIEKVNESTPVGGKKGKTKRSKKHK